MIVSKALYTFDERPSQKSVDKLLIEWFQAEKRIQRLTTASGQDIAIRFLGKSQRLKHGDVLYEDAFKVIVVEVIPCDVIQLKSENIYQLAQAAYEIGNKHLPLFWQKQSLMLPYDKSTLEWLSSSGFKPEVIQESLQESFQANVSVDAYKQSYTKSNKVKLQLK